MRIATIPRRVRPREFIVSTCVLLSAWAVPAAFGQSVEGNLLQQSANTAFAQEQVSQEIQLLALPGSTSAPVITALAGSRDGRYLAAAGDDHAIRVIDTQSGETIQTVLGHQDWIQSLLFVYPSSQAQLADTIAPTQPQIVDSDNAQSLVPDLYSAGHDGRVLRWRYTFPLEAEEVAIVPYAVRSISVSSSSQLLAIGGFSDEVLIFDLQQGLYLQRLKCQQKDQGTVKFSPDGARVLSGSSTGEIRVWDARSGQILADYREHQRRVYTAAFSSDGQYVTSAGADRRVVRFDIQEKNVLWSTELAQSKLKALCLLNDDMIAVAGADNTIRLVDAQSEAVVAELTGHSGTVATVTTCGENLASGSFDTTVRVWNLSILERDRAQVSLPTSATPIRIDPKTQIR